MEGWAKLYNMVYGDPMWKGKNIYLGAVGANLFTFLGPKGIILGEVNQLEFFQKW